MQKGQFFGESHEIFKINDMMIKKKFILISAPNDCGKSFLLRAVIRIIKWEAVEYFDSHYLPIVPPLIATIQDYIAIGEINISGSNISIAIVTFGDSAKTVEDNLTILSKYKSDIIIIATHTKDSKGSGFYYAKEYANSRKYKLFVASPYTEWSQWGTALNYTDTLSDLAAKGIIELVAL